MSWTAMKSGGVVLEGGGIPLGCDLGCQLRCCRGPLAYYGHEPAKVVDRC